jgi:hypothetical protein
LTSFEALAVVVGGFALSSLYNGIHKESLQLFGNSSTVSPLL